MSKLERQTHELDSAFIKTYEYLDEEALNDKEEELGFNEQKPLFDFADYFGFQSLHKKIAVEEEVWLDNEELDLANDPDDHFIIEDELRALLNTDAEVQIGTSVYKFVENGYFEITNGDISTLSLLERTFENYESLPENVIFEGNLVPLTNSSDCDSGRRKGDYKFNSNKDRRIKWKVSHVTYPWNRFVIAKTKNYKKKRRRWKKYRTYCMAQVYGHISGVDSDGNADCSVKVQFNYKGSNYYASSNNKKRVKHKLPVSTKTKSGWVKGYHSGGGGITYDSVLTW